MWHKMWNCAYTLIALTKMENITLPCLKIC